VRVASDGPGGLAGSDVVAVTGYGQPDDRERAADAGFDAHLVKPVDRGRLAEVLALPIRDDGNGLPSAR
jgi:CheY-like chemotaxis protein